MHREQRERKRAIRLLIVDAITVVSVVGIVLVLVGLVAGWRFNPDMTLEQNGLVQINTEPSGAKITIDGEPSLGNTNTSKMLRGGEHEITLSKEGYESWTKTITVTPGWLLNLQYPRLFKQNREKEVMAELSGLSLLSVAPDRKSLVYALNESTEWKFVQNIGDDKPKVTSVELSDLVKVQENNADKNATEKGKQETGKTGIGKTEPNKTEAEKSDAEKAEAEKAALRIQVKNLLWNENGDRVLVETKAAEFLMVNLKNVNESVNISRAIKDFKNYQTLTKEMKDAKIQKIRLANKAGSELLVMINNSLFKVNLNDKSMELTPVVSVANFEVFDSEVIYETMKDEMGLRYIGLYKDGDKTKLDFYVSEVATDSLLIGLSEHYGQKYVIFTVGPRLYVYRGQNFAVNNKDEMALVAEHNTWITPDSLEISHNGEFFVLRKGLQLVVYDAEVEKFSEYEFINDRTQWLDDFMLYGTEDGMLKAWDFDGTNVRTLVVDDAAAGFDATVTANNKYLYYVAGEKFELRREKL